VEVAKAARLRRTAARTRNAVPAGGQLDARLAGEWVDVEDKRLGSCFAQVEAITGRRIELDRWQTEAEEVIGRAVVYGHRQIRRKLVRIVHAYQGN
jgi:hypothetical protein